MWDLHACSVRMWTHAYGETLVSKGAYIHVDTFAYIDVYTYVHKGVYIDVHIYT